MCVLGGGGGVEGIGLVKKLKWDLVTIRIRKYDLKWSKIVTLKDQKVQWGAQLSVAILTQAISKTKNVCMNYFFNIFSKSQEIRGWRFKTTNQKSA